HSSINSFIGYGSILGPCAGLVGAITGMGFISGLSTVALPLLITMVMATILLTILTVCLVYYSEIRNMQRSSIVSGLDEWIDSINGAGRKLLFDAYSEMKTLTAIESHNYDTVFEKEGSVYTTIFGESFVSHRPAARDPANA